MIKVLFLSLNLDLKILQLIREIKFENMLMAQTECQFWAKTLISLFLQYQFKKRYLSFFEQDENYKYYYLFFSKFNASSSFIFNISKKAKNDFINIITICIERYWSTLSSGASWSSSFPTLNLRRNRLDPYRFIVRITHLQVGGGG